jgi:hypothetical protein
MSPLPLPNARCPKLFNVHEPVARCLLSKTVQCPKLLIFADFPANGGVPFYTLAPPKSG